MCHHCVSVWPAGFGAWVPFIQPMLGRTERTTPAHDTGSDSTHARNSRRPQPPLHPVNTPVRDCVSGCPCRHAASLFMTRRIPRPTRRTHQLQCSGRSDPR